MIFASVIALSETLKPSPAPKADGNSPSPGGEGRGEGEVNDPSRARVPRFVHRFPLTLTLSLGEREPAADDAVSPDNGPAIPDFKQPKSRTNHSPSPRGEGRGEGEVSDPARARVPRFFHRFPLTLGEREPAADVACPRDCHL